MNSISIIIPTLNEAKNISKLLWHLMSQSTTNNIKEIIVVDGGSEDETKSIVSNIISGRTPSPPKFYTANRQSRPNKDLSTTLEVTPITLITSKKGRAKQMNHGAKHSTGSILYFLHADSFPPKGFDRMIFREVEKGNIAGCFKMKFDSSHWWLQLAGWFTQFNWKACRGGDQSLFVTKNLFDELGGYRESYNIYEDIDLINKLYTKNQFKVIQNPIITSARRYQENGVWKLQFHFWNIYLKKWLGASAKDLELYYNKHIQ